MVINTESKKILITFMETLQTKVNHYHYFMFNLMDFFVMNMFKFLKKKTKTKPVCVNVKWSACLRSPVCSLFVKVLILTLNVTNIPVLRVFPMTAVSSIGSYSMHTVFYDSTCMQSALSYSYSMYTLHTSRKYKHITIITVSLEMQPAF